jgi:hypothetical protein
VCRTKGLALLPGTCSCAAGFTNDCGCGGNDDVDECFNKNCDCGVDVDECASSPCLNGAACMDSSTDATVRPDAFRCACLAGYADGVCGYAFHESWAEECAQADSRAAAGKWSGGRCGLDVDECRSAPCSNDAACRESDAGGGTQAVEVDAYQCVCQPGFANGWCEYDFIRAYAAECNIFDSDAPKCQDRLAASDCEARKAKGDCINLSKNAMAANCPVTCRLCATEPSDGSPPSGGGCDVDVDECASKPCANGAACNQVRGAV